MLCSYPSVGQYGVKQICRPIQAGKVQPQHPRLYGRGTARPGQAAGWPGAGQAGRGTRHGPSVWRPANGPRRARRPPDWRQAGLGRHAGANPTPSREVLHVNTPRCWVSCLGVDLPAVSARARRCTPRLWKGMSHCKRCPGSGGLSMGPPKAHCKPMRTVRPWARASAAMSPAAGHAVLHRAA